MAGNIRCSLQNSFALIKKRPLFALMIVLSQAAAIMSLYLCVGFINNAMLDKHQSYQRQLYFTVDLAGDEGSTCEWKDVRGDFDPLFTFLGKDANNISIVGGGYDGGSAVSLYSGIGGSDGELAPLTCAAEEGHYSIGDKITVEGATFTVAKTGKNTPDILINIQDYPDTAKVSWFGIELNEAVSGQRIEEISSKIAELFGGVKHISAPEPLTLKKLQINNMFIFISLLIMLISVVNISVYYRYIFKKREKQTAIFKINGASGRDVFLISLFEMLGTYFLSLVCSLSVFFMILPALREKYTGFTIFDDKKYSVIFALIYFLSAGAVSAVMSFVFCIASPAQSYVRAQKGGV